MTDNHNVHCFYVDHSFYNVRQLGSVYSKLHQDGMPAGDSAIIVATCQRIEVFTATDTNPLACHELPFRHISGREQLKERIVSICSGIESQILGEKNIYYQVKKACESSPDGNAIRHMFLEALAEAKKIRATHNFHSSMDYEDVATAILRKSIQAPPSTEVNLVIIGSGMLARSFLKNDIIQAYKNIFFITRAKKNLKKKMDNDLKKNVFTCKDFLSQPTHYFQCVIATNNIDKGNYFDEVRDVVTSPGCKGVFDLSATPRFDNAGISVFYADTYSDIYNKYVDKHNRQMFDQAKMIRSVISRTYRHEDFSDCPPFSGVKR